MSPFTQTTRTYNHIEIQPGARWTEPAQNLDFTLLVRCQSVNPDKFVGEVTFMGSTLLITEGRDNIDQAYASARTALKDRVIDLFADPGN